MVFHYPPLRHPCLLNFPFSPILSLSLRPPTLPIRFFPPRLSLFHLPPFFSFNENCGGSPPLCPSLSLSFLFSLSPSQRLIPFRTVSLPSSGGSSSLQEEGGGGEQRMWMGWVSPRLGERSITCEPKGEEIRGCAA